jgi:hypothetical protein
MRRAEVPPFSRSYPMGFEEVRNKGNAVEIRPLFPPFLTSLSKHIGGEEGRFPSSYSNALSRQGVE